MSGFLSKSKQRLEHTNKLSVGEFKALQSLLGQEKNLLNSHARVANDLRKASHSLDEWAQSEGPDLADTLGKVAKLLANDLAKAEEEYADHLANFRMYFKQLRTREEKFSQLKKNKDTLQGKIDSAEKKLSKMNPEHKDLATLTQKLSDLRSEMVSMDNAVISEDAAIGDYRRQMARSAVAHQLAALCQLGEKMTIIGELGKLLTYEIRLDKTEPGRDRGMYNGYDRTLQIYGEAQTCLHKVVFDASNSEAAYSSLPVPAHGDFDHSYEYDQEAQRQSQEAEQQTRGSKRHSSASREASLGPASVPYKNTYQQSNLAMPGAAPGPGGQDASPSFQPLETPVHIGLANDFSDAVNATWKEQEQQEQQVLDRSHHFDANDQAVRQHSATPMYPTRARTTATHQGASDIYQDNPNPIDVYGGAEYSREEEGDNEAEYVDESQLQAGPEEPPHQHEGITTINEETQSALQATEFSAGRGVGGFSVPSQTSSDHVQRHQLHDRPVPRDSEYEKTDHSRQEETPSTAEEAYGARVDATAGSNNVNASAQTFDSSQIVSSQNLEPTGEDLEGTGLYGSPSDNIEGPASADTGLPQHEGTSQDAFPDINPAPAIVEPAPLYTGSPGLVHAPPVSPQNVSLPASPPAAYTDHDNGMSSQQSSSRAGHAADLSSASALAAAAANSVRPRHNTSSSAKSVPRQQSIITSGPHLHSYTTVATSSKSPTTPVTPSSPPRREKTPPAKQHSYRSTNEAMGRSSIAYLNETPTIEPPMKAPPPTNLGMPLPSSSPYFNPYANLRNTSGGYAGQPASTSGGTSGASANRPKGSRNSTLDTSLGSKHGFDLRAVQQPHERPLLQQPSANLNSGAVREKDYSYAIRTGDDGGGRRLAAGAFRRANPSSTSIPSFRSGDDGATSPAQRLRDEWRNSQSAIATPATEFVTPAQTPGSLPGDTPDASARGRDSYMDGGDDMYGERAASRMPLSHRTSAIDAPTDVMPNDDTSHSDLHGIAEGNDETILPLNVRKKSPQASSAEFPGSNEAGQDGTSGFGHGQFVTRLE